MFRLLIFIEKCMVAIVYELSGQPTYISCCHTCCKYDDVYTPYLWAYRKLIWTALVLKFSQINLKTMHILKNWNEIFYATLFAWCGSIGNYTLTSFSPPAISTGSTVTSRLSWRLWARRNLTYQRVSWTSSTLSIYVGKYRDKSTIVKVVGPQEFNLPKSVVDIVYAQHLCW